MVFVVLEDFLVIYRLVISFTGFYTIQPDRPYFPPLLALVFFMWFYVFKIFFMVSDKVCGFYRRVLWAFEVIVIFHRFLIGF